jgi:hypothetical protein
MSNPMVLNPNKEMVLKELQKAINQYYEYLKTVKVDYRIVKDEYGDVIALVPVFHLTFKDTSDYVYELSVSE